MKKLLLGLLIGLGLTIGIAEAASILTVPQGGTGAGTFPIKRIIVSNNSKATGTLQSLAAGTDGQCLTASSTASSGFAFATCASSSLPSNGTVSQFLGNSATNVPAWLNSTSTTITNVDVNRADTYTSNGSYLFPYKSLATAIAASSTLGNAYLLSPGVYVDGAPDVWQQSAFALYGNESTYVPASGVTFPGSFDIYDLTIAGNVTESDNSLNFIHQFNNGVITGNTSLAGNATMNGMALVGTETPTTILTVLQGALTNVVGSIIYNQVQDYGILNLNDDQIQASSSKYSIVASSTGSTLNILGATLIQLGNGGAINVQNGATSTPNNIMGVSILTNSTTAISVINAGNSATFLCDYHANNLAGTTLYASGTNWIPCVDGALTIQTTTTLQTILGKYLATDPNGVIIATTTPQLPITLTTTGSSGAATFIANTLNIPNYSGGGGGSGGGWATSSPYYITNTFGTEVGINSSTPIGNLVVEGISGSTTPIFVVASSTNVAVLTVGSNGNIVSTGQFQSTIGSVSAPTYSFTGDTGSGFYNISPGNLRYSTSGTDRVQLSSNGISLFNGGSFRALGNNSASVPDFTVSGTGVGMTFSSSLSTADLFFSTNNTERFRLSTTGFSGFNSTTPTATLVVQGYSGSTTPEFIVSTSTGVAQLTVSAGGTTTVSSLVDSQLTSGNCVQAATGGILITTGSACGSGGNFVLNGMTAASSGIIATSTGGNNYFISTSSPVLTINLPQNLVNSVATTTSGNVFSISTSTLGSGSMLTINHPINIVNQVSTTTSGNVFSISTSTLGTGSSLTVNNPINLINLVATGTTGTDFNIATSSIGTTNSLTINIPTAANGVRGLLNSTDWNTFNNKQAALTNPDTGTGASPQATYWTGSTALSGSNNFEWWNTAQELSINSTTPFATVAIQASTSIANLPILTVASTTGASFLSVSSAGTTTVSHLAVGDLTAGNCVQAFTGGVLTTTGSACGSGGNFVLNGMTAASSGIIATSTGGNNYFISTSSPVLTINLPQNLINQAGTTTSGNVFSISTSSLGSGSSLVINNPINLINQVATSSSSSVFYVATSSLGTTNSLTINLPNNLQTTITNPVTGTGAAGQVSYWTSSSAQTGSANFLWNNTGQMLSINSTTPFATLVVQASSTSQGLPIFTVASTTGLPFFSVSSQGTTSVAATYTVASGSNITQLSISPTVTLATASTLTLFSVGGTISSLASMTPATALNIQSGSLNISLSAATTTLTTLTEEQTGVTFNTGTITSLIGQLINAPTISGSSNITNYYGLVIAPSSSTTKYTLFDGIGTTTPSATLMLQGQSTQTQDLFNVASSTGQAVFEILNNGNIKISGVATSSQALLMLNPSAQTVLQVDETASLSGLTIGTTTTASLYAAGQLVVQGNSASTTAPLMILASSTSTSLMQVDATGHVHLGGVTPTVSSCGTSPGITGNDTLWDVATGSASPTACTVTFGQPYKSVICVVTDDLQTSQVSVTATSTTAITMTMSAALNSHHIYGFCADKQ